MVEDVIKVGGEVRIVMDCRGRRFRKLDGKTGKIVGTFKVVLTFGDDAPEHIDVPVIQVGHSKIAGYECWWEYV